MAQPAPKYPIDLDTETADAREARLAWERDRLDEAFDDIAHGRVIRDEELDAWLADWVAGKPLS